jgi:hypothetical protein
MLHQEAVIPYVTLGPSAAIRLFCIVSDILIGTIQVEANVPTGDREFIADETPHADGMV